MATVAATSANPTQNTNMINHSTINLIDKFHEEGFLVIPSVLTPQFTAKLRRECMDIFHGVFEYLHAVGEIEFTASHRKRNNNPQLEPSFVESKKRSNDAASLDKYEYPMRLGMKNGYRELVMRSPGRYELVLLHDGCIPTQLYNDQNDSSYCCNDGRWLLSKKALLKSQRQRTPISAQNNQPDLIMGMLSNSISTNNTISRGHNCHTSIEEDTEDESCLKHLLSWILEFPYCSDRKQPHDLGANQRHHDDWSKTKQFMQLVDELFAPSSTNGNDNDQNTNLNSVSSSECCDGGSGRIEGRWNKQDYGYRLYNISLIVATPGSTSQPWHADGGHISLSQHEKCHVFNVFIPLVDIPLSLGPTELRPGTHFHTRNLAPMMLAAKARKALRPPVCPELSIGDALVFDYRILHRGMANVSDGGDDFEYYLKDANCGASDEGKIGNDNTCPSNNCGKNRPVLVLTFARKWFKDVCNFPQRSIFLLQK